MTDWRKTGQSAFDQPWQVSLFALTAALNDSGVFSSQDWSDTLADQLAQTGVRQPPFSNEDYFSAWLAALESLLDTKDLANAKDIDRLAGEWRLAYLSTSHGDPVTLD
ncbi:MAG: nitrile hydratase accessory protein [Rhodobacteraceae bacterium]|nr:nitrile hydratase accessory protein [Paracoccaceae bacterium]